MSPATVALRAGVTRGLIELRQSLTNGSDVVGQMFGPVAVLITVYLMRDVTVASSGVSLGALVLPSVLGMMVAFSGLLNIGQLFGVGREDGTLLRAKATLNGVLVILGTVATLPIGAIIGSLAPGPGSLGLQPASGAADRGVLRGDGRGGLLHYSVPPNRSRGAVRLGRDDLTSRAG